MNSKQSKNLKLMLSKRLVKQEVLFTHYIHPNINIHILHTDLYKFPVLMTRRICVAIRCFINWWSFFYSYDFTFNSRLKLKGVIRSQSLLMVKLGFSLAVSAIFANSKVIIANLLMTWVVKSLLLQARSQVIAIGMESKNQGMWKKVWSL